MVSMGLIALLLDLDISKDLGSENETCRQQGSILAWGSWRSVDLDQDAHEMDRTSGALSKSWQGEKYLLKVEVAVDRLLLTRCG